MKIKINPMNWFSSKNNLSNIRAESASVLLGDGGSITSSNAQKIATVFSCINIKANALAVIPIKTYLRADNGKKEDHNNTLYDLLRYAPNELLIASLYKKMISQDLDLRGNHYSQIVRNGLGEIVALHPLIADKMEVNYSVDRKRKVYKYSNQIIKSSKILHIFDIPDSEGLKGLSRIEYAKQSLDYAKSTSTHGNNLFKNSAMPSGSFEMPGTLGDDSYNRLKNDLTNKYSGTANAGKPLLLEGGLTFKPLAISNSDAEWLESRKYNREEVASIFGVPVAMLNDASNTSYGNLEQKYLEFYTSTVFPLTTILEEQFRLSLIRPEKRAKTVIKFKFNSMLRVDAKTKIEYYKTRLNAGSISPNEIREYEDENGFEGGDEYYLQLNMATIKNINKGDFGNDNNNN